MSEAIQFETPENIELSYHPAGLGTRFTAWLVDVLIMFVVGFVLIVLLIVAASAWQSVWRELVSPIDDMFRDMDPESLEDQNVVVFYFFGIGALLMGLGSFFYYGFLELFMRGQTFGKKMLGIRVVKSSGFSLDAVSILVRNIFRVIDHIPPLWLVPLLSARSQRAGDMVGGTIVVEDRVEQLSGLRERLSVRTATDAKFRFDAGRLKKLKPADVMAVERLFERWHSIPLAKRDRFLTQIVDALVVRVGFDAPSREEGVRFLEDLLAAEYRRQARELG